MPLRTKVTNISLRILKVTLESALCVRETVLALLLIKTNRRDLFTCMSLLSGNTKEGFTFDKSDHTYFLHVEQS